MELELTKLDEKAIIPSIEYGIADLSVLDLLTEVGRDGRLILIYRTGLSVKIPANHIGMLIPSKLAPIYSLEDAAGIQIFHPNYEGEIIGRYKVNTTSVPSIFEQGEVFAKFMLVPMTDLTFKVNQVENQDEDKTDNGQISDAEQA